MRSTSRSVVSLGAFLAFVLAAPPALAGGNPELDAILKKMSERQGSLKTLSADFVQEKSLALLAKPDVSKGHLYYEAPAKILWEYREPDQTILLIDEKNLIAYYPDLKKADKVDIADKRQRYEKYFGVGLTQDASMQEYFDIDLAKESGIAGTRLLILTPKSQRIEKYISEIRLWVDEATFLPRKLEYREESGDSTSYTLDSSAVNQPLPEGKFAVILPPDVEVTTLSDGLKSRRDQEKSRVPGS